MAKGTEAFRSIGEVAKMIGVAPHVLRYWETQFPLLKPMKRPDGRRYYRPDDVRLAAGLCEVLRDEGMTIRGARKMLARDRGEAVRARGAQRLGEAFGATSNGNLTEDEAEAAIVDTVIHDQEVPLDDPMQATSSDPFAVHPDVYMAEPEHDSAEEPGYDPTDDLADDPDPADPAGDDLPAAAPRSRQRRRRTADQAGLPLFPDMADEATPGPAQPYGAASHHSASGPVWLARLVALNLALRKTHDAGPAAQVAQRLRRAIADHYSAS